MRRCFYVRDTAAQKGRRRGFGKIAEHSGAILTFLILRECGLNSPKIELALKKHINSERFYNPDRLYFGTV
jgi:hypothetical protein